MKEVCKINVLYYICALLGVIIGFLVYLIREH